MMKRDAMARLEAFSAADFQRWLLDGVKRMNGIGGPMATAFAPVDAYVGHARDRTWTEDLARSIYPELSQAAGHRLCSGIGGGIESLAGEPLAQTWLPLTQMLELTRLLQPETRTPGIAALAKRLAYPQAGLPHDERVHLISAALLALFEAHGVDRVAAGPLALQLVRQLLAERADLSAAQKAIVAKRLLRLPGVGSAAVAELGLDAQKPPGADLTKRFYRPTPLPEEADYGFSHG